MPQSSQSQKVKVNVSCIVSYWRISSWIKGQCCSTMKKQTYNIRNLEHSETDGKYNDNNVTDVQNQHM